MARYEGDLTLGDTEAEAKPSGFKAAWESVNLGYGKGIEEESIGNLNKAYLDYSDNIEAYNEWRDLSNEITSNEFTRKKYNRAVFENNYFELDENNNIVPGEGHFPGADLFFLNRDALKGALLAKKNGYSPDKLEVEYGRVTKTKADEYNLILAETSGWTKYPAILASHVVEPETLIDFMSPGKVIGKTLLKGAAKAFAVEASVALVGETMREQRTKEHMQRAGLDYTLWDSVENILIGAGFAGAIRGIGSAVTDKITFNKINKGITNKLDKEIFARFAQRENYKLTKNSMQHLELLEKVREDIDAGRQVDVSAHTDIDINTKTDGNIEEVRLDEEVRAVSNIDAKEVQRFEKEIDEPPMIKDTTEADPYEGMVTPKEADKTILEVMDDPEIKALFDEIEIEKKRLSPQAQMVTEAKEPKIGGSEEKAAQEVKNLFKKKQQDPYSNYSKEDLEEVERLMKEDQELSNANADSAGVGGTSVFAGFGPELFVGGIAGVDEDEEGNLTFDPAKFITGMLAAHGAKFAVMKTSAFIKPGLKPKQKKIADKAIKKMQSKAAQAILLKGLAKSLDGELMKKLQAVTERAI